MAYNSTSWTTDALTKASNSTSTDDSLNISGTLTVSGASQLNSTLTIGTDADGTDRAITFGHSTLKSIMGIDDSADRFVINTDASFDGTIADNDFSIDASGNAYILGDLTVTGGKLTFGNSEYVSNETDSTVAIATNTSGSGTLIVSSTAETGIEVKGASADTWIKFLNAGSVKWTMGYDYSDSYTLKFDWSAVTGGATKASLDSSSSEISNSGLTVGDDTALGSNHVGADDKVLLIKITMGAVDDIVYGGYVTITQT
jgi:hypothetical protein